MDENTEKAESEKTNGNTGPYLPETEARLVEMKEVREAFEESPYLFDEILDVSFNPGLPGEYHLKVKNGAAIQYWSAVRSVTGEWAFLDEEAFARKSMQYDEADLGFMGGLLPPPLAKQMGDVIHQALGESPTPESCEKAIKLATAAQAFLSEMRVPYFSEYSRQRENLQALADQIGIIRDDDDSVP